MHYTLFLKEQSDMRLLKIEFYFEGNCDIINPDFFAKCLLQTC